MESSPDGFRLITRRLCLIKDTGHAGVLWGGNMMGWVDEAGGIFAGLVTRNRAMVTKAFTGIDFKRQVRPGDMVSFWGRVAKWGESSVHIEIKVNAARHGEEDEEEVLDVTGVFVAIDESGEKTKVLPRQGTKDRPA
jgi:acyl-CoA thioesterase YciA